MKSGSRPAEMRGRDKKPGQPAHKGTQSRLYTLSRSRDAAGFSPGAALSWATRDEKSTALLYRRLLSRPAKDAIPAAIASSPPGSGTTWMVIGGEMISGGLAWTPSKLADAINRNV